MFYVMLCVNYFYVLSLYAPSTHQDQIKKPIILTQDKEVRKDAVIWFKSILLKRDHMLLGYFDAPN